MITTYLRFVPCYSDPVWGEEATPWLRSQLIRCTRNRLRKATFEWVGNPRARCDPAAIRQRRGVFVQEAWWDRHRGQSVRAVLRKRLRNLEQERDAYKAMWELAKAIPYMTDAQLAELHENALTLAGRKELQR